MHFIKLAIHLMYMQTALSYPVTYAGIYFIMTGIQPVFAVPDLVFSNATKSIDSLCRNEKVYLIKYIYRLLYECLST